jgi:hypothetical protein
MRILVHHSGEQLGPFTVDEAKRMIAGGHLSAEDLAWHEGLSSWVSLGTILQQQPPQIPPRQSPAAVPVQPYRSTAQPGPTSGMAIASLVLGICTIAVCFLTGIPAIVCGHIARGEIRRAGGRIAGDGLAVAGLVLGYLSLVIPALIGIVLAVMVGAMGMTFPAILDEVRSSAVSTQHAENAARQVATALRNFSSDRGGKYPETLEDLVPDYLPDREMLRSPLSPTEPVGYLYFGGRASDPGNEPLMMSKATDRHGRRVVVRKNGLVVTEFAEPPHDEAI